MRLDVVVVVRRLALIVGRSVVRQDVALVSLDLVLGLFHVLAGLVLRHLVPPCRKPSRVLNAPSPSRRGTRGKSSHPGFTFATKAVILRKRGGDTGSDPVAPRIRRGLLERQPPSAADRGDRLDD